MRFPWRLTLGLALALIPPVAVGLWPAPKARAPQAAGHRGHGDHSAAALPNTSSIGSTPVPPHVGAAAWDGQLPAWPGGEKVLEVGPGRPLATIAEAMALAGDGDRVIVHGGRYHGSVRIERRVWLDVRDGAELMAQEGSAVYLTAPGARVTGLTITHAGDSMDDEDAGVQVRDAPGAVVAGCTIFDVKFGIVAKNSPGVLIAGNAVTGREGELSLMGDGIRVWYSDGARVEFNTIRHTREIIVESTRSAEIRKNAVVDSRQGLHLMNAPAATAVGNYMARNSTGIYVMYGADTTVRDNWIAESRGPSGYGIGLKEADGARVEGNVLVANRVGLYLENSPRRPDQPNTIAGNTLAQNDVGIALTPSTHSNLISGNDFVENLQQVSATGQGRMGANLWTVGGQGNHWSDYEGYDADGDGVGDVPHAPVRVFEGWMDRRPELRWFWFTPAAHAVDAAARAFPLAAPEPILTDERPAMAPRERRDAPWSSSAP